MSQEEESRRKERERHQHDKEELENFRAALITEKTDSALAIPPSISEKKSSSSISVSTLKPKKDNTILGLIIKKRQRPSEFDASIMSEEMKNRNEQSNPLIEFSKTSDHPTKRPHSSPKLNSKSTNASPSLNPLSMLTSYSDDDEEEEEE